MELENGILTEVNKAQRDKYHTFFLMCGYQVQTVKYVHPYTLSMNKVRKLELDP